MTNLFTLLQKSALSSQCDFLNTVEPRSLSDVRSYKIDWFSCKTIDVFAGCSLILRFDLFLKYQQRLPTTAPLKHNRWRAQTNSWGIAPQIIPANHWVLSRYAWSTDVTDYFSWLYISGELICVLERIQKFVNAMSCVLYFFLCIQEYIWQSSS
jgi:hypothetical protein